MPRAGLRSSGKTANAAAEMREHLKRLLAAEEVVLSAELAELLRHRELTWSLIPPLSRALVLPCLTLKETLRLDTAVTERGDEKNPRDRDHLIKAYRGLRCTGSDEWTFKDTNAFEGVRWARKRDMNLQNLKLEYKGERDVDKVLVKLVMDKNEDLATYYAARSEARDAKIRDNSAFKTTALIEALRLGYLEVGRCLLERDAYVNETNQRLGKTPLYWASYHGHVEVVKSLLAAEVEVDKADNSGETPLYGASRYGHLDVVKTLLAAGAEVNKVDSTGVTPLYRASSNGHLEVVKTLLAAGAEVDKANYLGETPLYWASLRGHLEVVKTLLAAGAEVDKVTSDGITWGMTPLYQASIHGHLEVVKTLLAAGAEVNKVDDDGETPLYWALHFGYTEIALLLREAGASE